MLPGMTAAEGAPYEPRLLWLVSSLHGFPFFVDEATNFHDMELAQVIPRIETVPGWGQKQPNFRMHMR